MGWPSRASSPWIRLCPHLGFSRARRRTSFLIAAAVGGRPVRAAPRAVVPLRRDQATVPGQQGSGGDREDVAPAVAGYEGGQRGEPEPVRGLVADRAGELAA